MNHFQETIGKFYGRRVPKGDIGLEVEVEFPNRTPAAPINSKKYWTSKPDGSLRNGIEYVLAQPIKAAELPEAIKDFADGIAGMSFVDSHRTSVHCHINVGNRTFDDLTRILTAYYLFENVFIAANDASRAGNLFCLRGKDAEWQVNEIAKCISTGWLHGAHRWSDGTRYAALNMAAPAAFGSVEFRFIEGTTDPKLIEFWAQTMYDFVTNTTSFDVEDQLRLVTSGNDGQFDFLNKVLTRPTELFDKLPGDWNSLVEENIPYGIAFRQAYLQAKRMIDFKPPKFHKPVIYQVMSDDLDDKTKKPTSKGKPGPIDDLLRAYVIPPPILRAEDHRMWGNVPNITGE